jgi:osmoprotectant transport system substrate-binding protein
MPAGQTVRQTRASLTQARDTEGEHDVNVKRFASILPAVALATALAACGSSSSGGTPPVGTSSAPTTPTSSAPAGASGTLTVASAAFTESNILAQIYADLLTKAGFTVHLKQVESSEVFQSSLDKGTIAVVPEYAATYADSLQTKVTGTQSPTAANPSLTVTLAHLKKWETKLGLTNLTPSKAVDQNAFAVTKAFATQHHLTTLSDLGSSGLAVKLAAPAECSSRPFCEPGLKNTYKINITGLTPLDFDSLPLKQAIKSGNVQLGEVSTTDATLSQLGLVTLTDDKHLQNADYLIPIVNAKQLAAHPQIATALNPLASVLTTADLGTLDNDVDGQRMTVQDVAKAYLTSKGLL